MTGTTGRSLGCLGVKWPEVYNGLGMARISGGKKRIGRGHRNLMASNWRGGKGKREERSLGQASSSFLNPTIFATPKEISGMKRRETHTSHFVSQAVKTSKYGQCVMREQRQGLGRSRWR